MARGKEEEQKQGILLDAKKVDESIKMKLGYLKQFHF